VQGYNAQLAVDSETQVIVAAEVTQQVLDRGQLLTMMESAERNLGQRPNAVTADAGYWDTETVQKAIHSGVQVLVPPDGAAPLKTGQPRQMTMHLYDAQIPPVVYLSGVLMFVAGLAIVRVHNRWARDQHGLMARDAPNFPQRCRGLESAKLGWRTLSFA